MMEKRGLVKLMEECGELIQIAAKKTAFMDVDLHPDGGSLKMRMENEVADVVAACSFVVDEFALDQDAIARRLEIKLATFKRWHEDKTA